MIYSGILSEEQKQGLRDLQKLFSWNDDQLDYLIACMAFESGLDPKARNSVSGAVGLIQFMPAICKAYGTTAQEMRRKSFVGQLPYVIEHFKPYYKRTKTLSDMYIYLIKYWDELKQKFGNDFTLEAAVKDFKKEYSQKHIVNRIKNLFAKRKMNN